MKGNDIVKSRYLRSTLGVLFLLAAILASAYLFGWWDYSFEFTALMGTIPIILSVIWIFLFGTNVVNSVLYFAGIGYILYENGFANTSDERIYLVIIMALMALALTCLGSAAKSDKELDPFLLKPSKCKKKNAKKSTFGHPRHVKCTAKELKSGKFTARFGTLCVSLDETELEPDTVINAKAFFGKVKLRLPAGAVPKVVSDCAFGKTAVRLAAEDDSNTNFILNSQATFGRIVVATTPSVLDEYKGKPFVKIYKENDNTPEPPKPEKEDKKAAEEVFVAEAAEETKASAQEYETQSIETVEETAAEKANEAVAEPEATQVAENTEASENAQVQEVTN